MIDLQQIFLIDHRVENGAIGLERCFRRCIFSQGRPFPDGPLVAFAVVIVESGLVEGVFIQGGVVPVAEVRRAGFGVPRRLSGLSG